MDNGKKQDRNTLLPGASPLGPTSGLAPWTPFLHLPLKLHTWILLGAASSDLADVSSKLACV